MSPVTYAFAVASSVFTLALVVWLLRRGRLRERHAIWWLIASSLALIVSIFPATLAWATSLLGFSIGSNLVYFTSIAILVLVCIQHSSELTRVEAQVRTLAEEVALLRLAVSEPDDPSRSDRG
ncbi:hypothetical protein CLV46_0772 [Diaminobutyricimonas aerilata]|uniref:DUF2304 domain-containing protein n=1 Tax=Diaminobutyricimonas aerilata TaxID=1162967 RepID=A0A2M9CH85_9MICO|nr:DUF2304 domain-containing protein [Diaminobutyricimonas aerilata]PJJ71230.1 hypothetical protein CLV46_0772 [Diaminobutyricimonas aerilata]